MLRHITAACIFSTVLLVPQVQAACATANPLDALAGDWTFTTKGFNFPPTFFLASAGRFTAAVQAAGPRDLVNTTIGVLFVNETTSVDGGPTRLITDIGSPSSRYQVNGDCTGGTLTFNTPHRPDQFDFYFDNPNEIVFVGSNNGDIVTGRAKRITGPLVCAANALATLSGTWTFLLDGFQFPPTLFLANAGRFNAFIGVDPKVAGLPVLDIIQSVGIDGSPVRLESEKNNGRYGLNDNCQGGNLTFNTGSRPAQYDFWFNSATEMVLVGSNNGDIVVGSARKQP